MTCSYKPSYWFVLRLKALSQYLQKPEGPRKKHSGICLFYFRTLAKIEDAQSRNSMFAFRGALSLRICAALDAQPHVDECVAFKKVFLRKRARTPLLAVRRRFAPNDKVE